jgi:hypothetical protein
MNLNTQDTRGWLGSHSLFLSSREKVADEDPDRKRMDEFNFPFFSSSFSPVTE